MNTAVALPIHETFQGTIQGEGALAGTPADFIRLYGCPVGCPWCDTGYQNGGKEIPYHSSTIDELLQELTSSTVIITGGEPFIHKGLPQLCSSLLANGKQVSIETSGSRWSEVPSEVWVTLSPKEHISPKYPVVESMWKRANEVKIVIETRKDLDFYLPKLREHSKTSVFLQPEWSSRASSLPITLELLQEFNQYRLSVQLHKYINVP